MIERMSPEEEVSRFALYDILARMFCSDLESDDEVDRCLDEVLGIALGVGKIDAMNEIVRNGNELVFVTTIRMGLIKVTDLARFVIGSGR